MNENANERIRQEVLEQLLKGNKLQAIKILKESSKCGLREAKDAIDLFEKELKKKNLGNFTSTNRSMEDITSNATFIFVVDDVFTIAGRGVVVTGNVTKGSVRVNETLTLKRIDGKEHPVVCNTIEKFRKISSFAQEGENVGMILSGIQITEIEKDAIIYSTANRIPVTEHERRNDSAKRCFIATACYGSADSIEVEILRNFRDRVMLKSYAGNFFTRIYYTISPPFAKFLSANPRLASRIRKHILDPIVRYASNAVLKL